MLSALKIAKESWGLEDVDFDDLYIGSPVYAYDYVDGCFLENSKLYPITSNGVLLLWAIDSGSMVTISTELVSQVNDMVVFDDPFSIIYDSQGCYICTENYCELLSEYCEDSEEDVKIQARSILLPEDLRSSTDIIFTSLSDNNLLKFESQPTAYSESYYIWDLNVPYINQRPSRNLCWAACVACIANYVKGYTLTAEEVAFNYFGDSRDETLNFKNIPGVLHSYDIRCAYRLVFPLDYMIYENLRVRDFPLYSRWVTNDGTDTSEPRGAHACVISGINTFTGTLTLMDPIGGIRRTAEAVPEPTGENYSWYSFWSAKNGCNFYLQFALLKE